MTRLSALFCVFALGLVSGCDRLPEPFGMPPALELTKHVVAEEISPSDDGAPRYEVRLVSKEGYTVSDHSVALMMEVGKGCNGKSFTLESHPALNVEDQTAPSVAGTSLWMRASCGLDLLPNHVAVASGSHALVETPLPGTDTKQAFSTVRKHQTDMTVVNQLLGGFVREVATEDCAGKAVVIERIATGTEMLDATLAAKLDAEKYMHATMHFRCLDVESSSIPAASAP